jgi:hypothetical protein
MHAMLVVFGYGGIHRDTVNSLVGEMAEKRDGVNWAFSAFGGDAAIDRSRSVVASRFLEQDDCSVLVSVDHDIVWQPGEAALLASQAETRRAFVGGLYSKRTFAKGYGGRFKEGTACEFGTYDLVPLGEHEYLGGGFTAIHRSVLEQVVKHADMKLNRTNFYPLFSPFTKKNEQDEEYLSEDWAFNARVHDAGCPVYCSMHPVLCHSGEYGYTVLGTASQELAL